MIIFVFFSFRILKIFKFRFLNPSGPNRNNNHVLFFINVFYASKARYLEGKLFDFRKFFIFRSPLMGGTALLNKVVLSSAVKGLTLGRAPGMDGIAPFMLQEGWEVLAPNFLKLCIGCLRLGIISCGERLELSLYQRWAGPTWRDPRRIDQSSRPPFNSRFLEG